MRFFLHSPELSGLEWFVFIDDDIYLRPLALTSMLQSIDRNNSLLTAIGIISSTSPHSIKFIKPKPSTLYNSTLPESCAEVFGTSYYNAQPAILNRAALIHLKPAVNSNALTRLQKIWGRSHDAILGLLLWQHEIPLYSLTKSYHGKILLRENLQEALLADHPQNSLNRTDEHCGYQSYIAFHRIVNFKMYERRKKEENFRYKGTVVSQYDISGLLGEQAIYDDKSPIDCARYLKLADRQRQLGASVADNLLPLHSSRIQFSHFMLRAQGFPQVYFDFLPQDCRSLYSSKSTIYN